MGLVYLTVAFASHNTFDSWFLKEDRISVGFALARLTFFTHYISGPVVDGSIKKAKRNCAVILALNANWANWRK